MSTAIDQQIQEVVEAHPKAEKTVESLVREGAKVVDPILTILPSLKSWQSKGLVEVLSRIRDPQVVPIAKSYISHTDTWTSYSSFMLLGLSGSDAAIDILATYLTTHLYRGTAWAATALGFLGGPKAKQALEEKLAFLVAEDEVLYNVNLVGAIATSLSKMGSQVGATHLIELAKSEDVVTYMEAVKALGSVIAPALLDTLQGALQDDAREIQEDAVRALYYVATKEAIDLLVNQVDADDASVQDAIMEALCRLTALPLDEDASSEEVVAWWEEAQAEYQSRRCYRYGKPLDIGILVQQIREAAPQAPSFEEFYLLTGEDLGLSPLVPPESHPWPEAALERLVTWWEENQAHFEVGQLYRYGHKIDFDLLYG